MNDNHESREIPEDLLEALTHHALGELPERDAAHLEARLKSSPALREELEQLHKTLAAVHEEMERGARPGLTSERRRALRTAVGAAQPRRRRWVLSLSLAAAAAVLVTATLLMMRSGREAQTAAFQYDLFGQAPLPATSDALASSSGKRPEEGSAEGVFLEERKKAEKLASDAEAIEALGYAVEGGGAPVETQSAVDLGLRRDEAQGLRDAVAEGATPDSSALERLRALGYIGEEVQENVAEQGHQDSATFTVSGAPAPAPASESAGYRLSSGSPAPTPTLTLGGGASGALRGKATANVSPAAPTEPTLRVPVRPYDHGESDVDHDAAADARTQVQQILDSLARRPGETPDMMYFRYFGDHPFVDARRQALSTFAMDVDTASYALVRSYLSRAVMPPREAVRTEEFVNSFDYRLTPPSAEDGGPFAIHLEATPSPFGAPGSVLLRVGIRAREVSREARKPVALTFVIDTSGSMEQEQRLELVKQSLHLLVNQLDARDSIGIVAFESSARRVLEPHSLEHRRVILAAIDSLEPGGSTNAGDGLLLGYQMALGQFREDGENRVILCSDGVANTGTTSWPDILATVKKYREDALYLTSVGVGMGNHNDELLEQLADHGDGQCRYVDTLDEARRIFVDELTGTLQTVAKDAKIQVEFHPEAVRRYRLLGYENRTLTAQDFRNDSVDAGEVGAGHSVTALYELECPDAAESGPLATVRVRALNVASGQVREQEATAPDLAATRAAAPSRAQHLASCVAEFAELLRRSSHAEHGSLAQLLSACSGLVVEWDQDPQVAEFVALVLQCARLPDLLPPCDELTRTLNELRHCRHREAILGDYGDDTLLREIRKLNERLESRVRTLFGLPPLPEQQLGPEQLRMLRELGYIDDGSESLERLGYTDDGDDR